MNYAEIIRRLENMLRPGTIAEVDHGDPDQDKPPRCRVKTGGLTTGWLPWFVVRAGTTKDWDPPTVGEQCLAICPSGAPEHGFVLLGLYSAANPAPANSATLCRRTYPDGAVIDYDHAAHRLRAILPEGGITDLVSTGGINITGPINHQGDYTQQGNQNVTGTVTVSEDVIAGAISLVNHRTKGVTPGTGVSQEPTP